MKHTECRMKFLHVRIVGLPHVYRLGMFDRYTNQLSTFAGVSCRDMHLPPLEGTLSAL